MDHYHAIAIKKACLYFYLASLVEIFRKLKYALWFSVLMKKVLIKSESWTWQSWTEWRDRVICPHCVTNRNNERNGAAQYHSLASIIQELFELKLVECLVSSTVAHLREWKYSSLSLSCTEKVCLKTWHLSQIFPTFQDAAWFQK